MDGGGKKQRAVTPADDFGGIDPNARIGDNNLADNLDPMQAEGGPQQDMDPEEGDQDVDQFFDDGGETFLPADHVT